MNTRDHGEDRAALLLKSVEPELLRLLKNAPEYGLCGIDFVFHNSEIVRIGVKSEVTRKAKGNH
ncbi:MAG: hypothetical protein LBS06_05350 [Treponema sp.]|jgi:hypothetical protein|nr:hypothetical protein [Treponema sp.]